MGKNRNKSKKKSNNNGLKLIVVLAIIVVCVFVVSEKKEQQKQIEVEQNIEKREKELAELAEQAEKERQEKIRQKIDIDPEKGSYFIQNCEQQLYKMGEKELRIPVLIYHNFQTPIPYETDTYKLFSSMENFEENVTTLLNEGYTFITLNDIALYKEGVIGLPEKNVCITIDDGHIGCYTDVFPVLQKYDIPATIFIINDSVGATDYFSWEQAKEMYQTGLVKLHCHGYSHLDATQYSTTGLKQSYNNSYNELVSVLGDDKIEKIMAYPAGASNASTIASLKEEGFNIQVQTRYGTVNKSSTLDLTNIGRIRGERATGAQILNAIKY